MKTIRVIIAFELSELEPCHFKRLQWISMVEPHWQDKETSFKSQRSCDSVFCAHSLIALWLQVYWNDLSLERRCQRWGIQICLFLTKTLEMRKSAIFIPRENHRFFEVENLLTHKFKCSSKTELDSVFWDQNLNIVFFGRETRFKNIGLELQEILTVICSLSHQEPIETCKIWNSNWP